MKSLGMLRLLAKSGGIRATLRGAFCYLTGRRVGPGDYAAEYDAVADTYPRWTARMGRHADPIIRPECLPRGGGVTEVLDLACGQGYITRRLLERWDAAGLGALRVTAVDISRGMLDACRRSVDDPRVTFVHADGGAFLERVAPESYDAIFMAWALPYFDHAELLARFRRALKPGGVAGVITNSQGTLRDMEEVILEVVAERRRDMVRIMDATLNLPAGRDELRDWFAEAGLDTLDAEEGEEVVVCPSAAGLYDWMRRCGALAGVGAMFRDLEAVEPAIIRGIERKRKVDGGYAINHRFARGMFRRGG